jgi:hypothetical protein
MFHDAITVSSCFLNFIIFFQNSNVLVISRFQWLISAEGEICNTFDIIISTKSVLFKFGFWGIWGGGLQPGSPPPPGVAPIKAKNCANECMGCQALWGHHIPLR